MDRQRVFLLLFIAVLVLLSVLFVLPFLDYFLLAVILAYVLWPVQQRLERITGPTVAAASIVLATAVVVVVPALFVVRTTFFEGRRLLEQIRAGEVTFASVESSVLELTGMRLDLSGLLQRAVDDVGIGAFGDVVSLVGTLAHVAIGVGLTLFLLYYFLKDGESFVAWLRDVLPLSEDGVEDLFTAIDDITWAVLAGHVFVAIVQGILAGLGLWATGVPNSAFWTVVMVVLALLPIIGSFMVWGPAVVWLFVTGSPVPAVALLIYGTVIVGISDDYLRPIVVDRYAEVNPAVIIIGVLGGIYVIGFMGIFVGPVIIGSLRAALTVYDSEFVEKA